MTTNTLPTDVDVLIVGAGIVGLAHALSAHERGARVLVIERDEHAVGASIRNFGHICATAQTGQVLDYAWRSRERWLSLADAVPLRECGTVVVARSAAEHAVLEEFAAQRGADQVTLLSPSGVTDRIGSADERVVGGALLPLDLRTDSRTAIPALTAHLRTLGIDVHFGTNALAVEPGLVRTNRGTVRADRIVLAVGHDVDRMFPEVADSVALQRCALHMMQVQAPGARTVEPAVLTGLSMLRYGGLASQPAAADVRAQVLASTPELLDAQMNLMFTQLPSGDLVIGDTHVDALTHDPFAPERIWQLELREIGRLLATDQLTVTHRWRGFYAHSEHTDYVDAQPMESVQVSSVTSGIGMTTAFGFAEGVISRLL